MNQLLIGILFLLGLPGGVLLIVYRHRLARLARTQNSILSQQSEGQLARGILVPAIGFLCFAALGAGMVLDFAVG